jgi:hypothetical protein
MKTWHLLDLCTGMKSAVLRTPPEGVANTDTVSSDVTFERTIPKTVKRGSHLYRVRLFFSVQPGVFLGWRTFTLNGVAQTVPILEPMQGLEVASQIALPAIGTPEVKAGDEVSVTLYAAGPKAGVINVQVALEILDPDESAPEKKASETTLKEIQP